MGWVGIVADGRMREPVNRPAVPRLMQPLTCALFAGRLLPAAPYAARLMVDVCTVGTVVPGGNR